MSVNYEELLNQLAIEHNNVRKDPQSLIPYLEENLKYFRGDVLYRPRELPWRTNEGKSALNEAIEFLKTQQPINEMKFDLNLSSAAQDHANDIGSKGLVTHDGTDGSNASDRIERYCEWDVTLAENIDFGNKTAKDILMSLIVDDGVKSRGHRKNVFNPNLTYFGAAIAAHKQYEICVVIDYTGGVRNKDQPFFDYSNFKYQYPDDLTKKPEKKPKKNTYQIDDEDAPDNTVAVKVVKQTKLYDGKVHRVTKKFYSLSDGTQFIVEVEDA